MYLYATLINVHYISRCV